MSVRDLSPDLESPRPHRATVHRNAPQHSGVASISRSAPFARAVRARLGGQHDMATLLLHPALPRQRVERIFAVAARDHQMRPGIARGPQNLLEQFGRDPRAVVLLTQCEPPTGDRPSDAACTATERRLAARVKPVRGAICSAETFRRRVVATTDSRPAQNAETALQHATQTQRFGPSRPFSRSGSQPDRRPPRDPRASRYRQGSTRRLRRSCAGSAA